MPSSTVEDYVKAVYSLQHESPTGEATVVRLAAVLGVTKGSVTSMVRKLRDAQLVRAERYGGITLTAKGETLAIDIIRRHRLIEVFLVRTLGLDWAEVHEEAERLEHAMSAKVLDRLDEFLGHPAIDPHGDPIPNANGELAEQASTPLADMAEGARGVIARISDDDPGFLEFAAAHGLRPGARIGVVRVTPDAHSMSVKASRRPEVSLSLDAAKRVRVDPEMPRPPRGPRPRPR